MPRCNDESKERERRKKISDSLKRIGHSPKPPSTKGLKWKMSEKDKQKQREIAIRMGRIPPSVKGKHWKVKTKRTIEHRLANSNFQKTRRGIKSANWKGGITLVVNLIRSCFKYRQWRSDVFTRDNFSCQLCKKRGGEINADHIKRFSVIIKENKIKTLLEAENCEELWNINNGRTLCLDCHKKITFNN